MIPIKAASVASPGAGVASKNMPLNGSIAAERSAKIRAWSRVSWLPLGAMKHPSSQCEKWPFAGQSGLTRGFPVPALSTIRSNSRPREGGDGIDLIEASS
jgi:hypothetical protein